jgi:hypothetical protein
MGGIVRLHVGDVVRLRKPHPCGDDRWEILRLGADVFIRCLGCGRRVFIPRVKLERRIKAFVHQVQEEGEHKAPP